MAIAPQFISQRRFGAAFDLSDKTIGRYIKAGRIKAVKIGKIYRIPITEQERFAAELAVVPVAKPEGAA